jgi:uncharacterized protein YggE
MKFIAAFFAVLGFAGAAFSDVQVTGTGSVSVTPDNVIITVTVSHQSAGIGEVVKGTTDKSGKVLSMLVNKLDIPSADICTHSFSVQPQYQLDKNGNTIKINGYQAQNYFIITVRDIANAEKVLTSLGEQEVTINSFSFVVSDKLRNMVLDEARKLAVLDAVTKAELYTKNLGVGLGLVKSVSEVGTHIPRYESAARANFDSGAVSPGTARVQVTINVSFAIK